MMHKARQVFEVFMLSKGKKVHWDGSKYNTPNIQTKWRYFLIGWMQREIHDGT
jgi:hypothetical protein